MAKTSVPTDIVLGARAAYLDRLQSVLGKQKVVPYMQQAMDPKAYDRQVSTMSEQDMQQLAQTNPKAAQNAAARIAKLESQNPQSSPLPAQDDFSPLPKP